ncbi:hypothetical protein BJ508DRAFT_419095 [Ascobolus immersus RN42]|uniref:Cleavage and polyadenylation specificity factor subunit 2 n=1 Tax=Ascobolus immersus RN42 TaxID=1160509 RepID=A0A3N4HGW8_ASCIM|nr:hypothetical protein BJ508DRAFT_419095 [Ascobolus immersus RN42]
MFHFISLLGAQSESAACQSLLELDNGIRILIDVGWDETFELEYLKELERYAPTISLILLTHPTLSHLGAYAHACKHIPGFRSIPTYATFPVISLGRLLLQDLYLSTPISHGHLLKLDALTIPASPAFSQPALPAPTPAAPEGSSSWLLNPPTSAEIESFFNRIIQLKYSQPHPITFLPSPITITAYSAGHTLGGTIWKVTHGQENIVHAVHWNHSKDHHISGAAFLQPNSQTVSTETLGKPSALICSSTQPDLDLPLPPLTRRTRDEALLATIKRVAWENGGTVLISTDSVARVLEIAYFLEQTWRKDSTLAGIRGPNGRKGVGLYMAGRRGKRLSKAVGRMMEWMSDEVLKALEASERLQEESKAKAQEQKQSRKKGKGKQQNEEAAQKVETAGPFDFVHLQILEKRKSIERLFDGSLDISEKPLGMVILAADKSLEWGFSKEILAKIAGEERNCVILTEKSGSGIGKELWNEWQANVAGKSYSDGIKLENQQKELKFSKRIPLEGEELNAYNAFMADRMALQSARTNVIQTTGPAGIITTGHEDDDDVSSSDDDEPDSDSEKQGKSLSALTLKKTAPGMPLVAGQTVDIGVNVLIKGEGIYDYDVRQAKGRNRMFPFMPKRRRVDDYGEWVRPDDYIRAEERGEDVLDGDDAEKEKKAPALAERIMGKKRKWEDLTPGKSADANKKKGKAGKLLSGSDADSGEEEEEGEVVESDAEPESDSEAELESQFHLPSKLLDETQTITLNCQVTYIDYQGLHDSKTLQNLLPKIKPRKLILIAGTTRETDSIASYCRNLWTPKTPRAQREVDIYTPQNGETVNASVDTNAWVLRLSDTLVRQLKWQNVGTLSVSPALGILKITQTPQPGDEPDAKRQKMDLVTSSTAVIRPVSTDTDALTPITLDTPPALMAAATRASHHPILVGDIKLPDLRKALQQRGIQAEFRGPGQLLCDGAVMVQKEGGTGRLVVEDRGGGWRGGLWKRVREVVYGGLAVVVGGN